MPRSEILEGITKTMRGIEVAPWIAPFTPKREGFNCLTLDVFNSETLRERAKRDPDIPDEKIPLIEDVDLVGSATEIAELISSNEYGTFDYVVSSHNFEHLPNPIKFLQGCEKLLKRGGVLSMAIPDAYACFDIFRPLTTTVDWLVAFKENRTKPTPEQIFEHSAYHALARKDGAKVVGDLGAQYETWLVSQQRDDYQDAHCSVMTPASFELLITECRYLGLLSMELESISPTVACGFYARLINSLSAKKLPSDINEVRSNLMHRILHERTVVAEAQTRMKKPSFRKKLSMKYIHPLKRAISAA